MNRFILCVLLLLGVTACGPHVEPQAYSLSEAQAREALQTEKYHQTILFAQQGLAYSQTGADSANLYYLTHYAYIQLEEYLPAAIQLKLALSTNPPTHLQAKFLTALSHTFFKLNQMESAYESGLAAYELIDEVEDENLAFNYIRMNLLKAAINADYLETTEKILSELEDHKELLSSINREALLENTLWLYLKTEQYQKVVVLRTDLLHAIDSLQNRASKFFILNNLAWAYIELQEYHLADPLLDQALSLYPNHPLGLYNKMLVSLNTKPNRIIEYADQLIHLPFSKLHFQYHPHVSSAYRKKIQQLTIMGELDEARITELKAAEFDEKVNREITRITQQLAGDLNTIDQVMAAHRQTLQQQRYLSAQKDLQNTVLILIALLGLAMILSIWRMRVLSKRRVLPQDIVDRTNELARILQLDDPRDS